MSMLGVAGHYSLLLVLVLIAGTSSAFFHVPTPVMMRKISGKYVGKGMSYYMLGGEIARTAGPVIILWAVSQWGLEGTYRLMPFGLLTSFLLFLKFRNVDLSNHQNPGFQARHSIVHTLKKHARFFIAISGYLFTRALLKSSLTAFLPSYLNLEKNHTLWFSGLSLSVLQISAAAGTFISGTLSDYTGRKKLLLIIAVISPVLMFLFLKSENVIFHFVTLVLIGLVNFSTGPVLLAYVQDQDKDRPAFMNSVYMTIAFTIASLTVFLTGLISDWVGIEKTYYISSWVAFTGVIFLLFIKENKS